MPGEKNAKRPLPAKSNSGKARSLFLVGFMGAGKTTVGQELAQRLGWRFVDLDDRIIASAGKSPASGESTICIADIFHERGEESFRRAESSALKELLAELKTGPPTVAALGGGAFVQPENFEMLRQRKAAALIIFLDAPVEELLRRCRGSEVQRPLFSDENRFRHLYTARHSGYMKAEVRVETGGKTIAEVAAEIAGLV